LTFGCRVSLEILASEGVKGEIKFYDPALYLKNILGVFSIFGD